MNIKKILAISGIVISAILVCGLVAAAAIINSWRATPYGELDFMAAIILKIYNSEKSAPEFPAPAERRVKSDIDFKRVSGSPEPVRDVKDISIPLGGRQIRARVYKDSGQTGLPMIVYFHGGGWVLFNVESYDNLTRLLCRKTGALLVSVDYRLAPENPFPAAVQDAFESTLWISRNAAALGGDPGRLTVCGDSAGANLAAVVARMAAGSPEPKIAFQILICPCLDVSRMDTDSYARFADGFILTRRDMEYYTNYYLPNPPDRKNPFASPLLSEVPRNMAPALIITAQFDVLHDEGQAYGDKLKAAGIPVKYAEFKGVFHDFISMTGVLPKAHEAIDLIAAEVRSRFGYTLGR